MQTTAWVLDEGHSIGNLPGGEAYFAWRELSPEERQQASQRSQVETLCADVRKWQEKMRMQSLPTQGQDASPEETNLAIRWSKMAHDPALTAEGKEMMKAVPGGEEYFARLQLAVGLFECIMQAKREKRWGQGVALFTSFPL